MSTGSKNDSDFNRQKPRSDRDWMPLDSSTNRLLKPAETGAAPTRAPVPAIPGYQIIEEWGESETGIVFKARHLKLDCVVALTLIADSQPQQAERLDHFKMQYRRLTHANIQQLIDAGEWEGHLLLAFEYVEGEILSQWQRRARPPHKTAAAITERIARALHETHAQGIVHGNLGADNIIVAIGMGSTVLVRSAPHPQEPGSPDLSPAEAPPVLPSASPSNTADALLTVPKVTGFGIAALLGNRVHGRQHDPVAALKCRSPEQTRNPTGVPTPSSDIYALGVILYEMLTGHPPFEGTTPVDTALLIQSQPPVAPRRFRPWLPSDLETICLTCLQKKPERRFQSAGELADELTRYLNDQRIKTRSYGWLRRAFRRFPRSR